MESRFRLTLNTVATWNGSALIIVSANLNKN